MLMSFCALCILFFVMRRLSLVEMRALRARALLYFVTHAYMNVPFCMLFSDSSELFLFILCEFFFCSDLCRTCERCESLCHGGKKKRNEFRYLRKVRKGFQS